MNNSKDNRTTTSWNRFRDDRTEEQKSTHVWAWVGTDAFMTGWGHARAGKSYAGWAFPDGYSSGVESFVRSRSDMKRVRLVYLPDYRPARCHDVHIYVADEHQGGAARSILARSEGRKR